MNNKCIYHGLCNLFFGVLYGMLFYCFISGRLYILELFSFIFIRVLRPSLRPQNQITVTRGCQFLLDVFFFLVRFVSLMNHSYTSTIQIIFQGCFSCCNFLNFRVFILFVVLFPSILYKCINAWNKQTREMDTTLGKHDRK